MGAEELCGEIGNLVGLIENHGVGGSEQIAEAVLFQRQIRQQQVMVDDDESASSASRRASTT